MALPRTSFSRRPLVALIVLILLLVVGYTARGLRGEDHRSAPPAPTSVSAAQDVALSSLPRQAIDTIGLIQRRGPFPYSQDGVVFQNLEHRLPKQKSGYYHEYTVPTPGSTDRGTRRIITGSGGQFYYTADHYATFHQIALGR